MAFMRFSDPPTKVVEGSHGRFQLPTEKTHE